MSEIAIRTGLDFPVLPAGHKLRPLLAAMFGGAPAASASRSTAHWDASFFNLDRASLFRDATPEEQAAILECAGAALLEEAYFIEKSGLAFAAKMVLTSETMDERMLYARFAGEEATHLAAISAFVPAPDRFPAANPFLALLSELIEASDRATLQFVVQIVLEGWGLAHYRDMRDGCAAPELRAAFTAILADEAAHHGSGVVLFNACPPSAESEAAIVDALVRFLRMVQVGPQSVALAIEKVRGHLSRVQRIRLFEELGAEAHSRARLERLRALMKGDSAKGIAVALDSMGVFRPFTPEECA